MPARAAAAAPSRPLALGEALEPSPARLEAEEARAVASSGVATSGASASVPETCLRPRDASTSSRSRKSSNSRVLDRRSLITPGGSRLSETEDERRMMRRWLAQHWDDSRRCAARPTRRRTWTKLMRMRLTTRRSSRRRRGVASIVSGRSMHGGSISSSVNHHRYGGRRLHGVHPPVEGRNCTYKCPYRQSDSDRPVCKQDVRPRMGPGWRRAVEEDRVGSRRSRDLWTWGWYGG